MNVMKIVDECKECHQEFEWVLKDDNELMAMEPLMEISTHTMKHGCGLDDDMTRFFDWRTFAIVGMGIQKIKEDRERNVGN